MTESPVLGAVTSSSAVLTVRTDQAADVQVEYADNKNFNSPTVTAVQTTASSADFTTKVTLSSLAASDIYWYRVLVGPVSGSLTEQDTGNVLKFTSFPSSSTASCTAALFADVANVDRTAVAYKNGKDDGALFALQIGDMDHGNPTTLAASRAMHRDVKDETLDHGGHFAQHVSSKMGIVRMWDDHDYCGNDTDKNCSSRAAAQQAYKEHWAHYSLANGSAGLWHSFTCGAAEFFVLDTRSQRDAGLDTDNTNKSMLDGDLIADDQKDWLLDGLISSTATWKIVVSSVTTNDAARPTSTDIWHAYSTEAGEIADYIVDNDIDNVFVVSADIHTGGGVDDGTNGLFGVPEMSVPHTNLAAGNSTNLGTWSEGVTSGVGGAGYAIVETDDSEATLTTYSQGGVSRQSLTLVAN
jgi:alkaline phosphatase D